MENHGCNPGGAAGRVIGEEIAARGAISVARFMELALYAPGIGYYETAGRRIGRAGDFYTSVSVGPLFGFLLAMRFADLCAGMDPVTFAEAAAHDGQLADDILSALERHRPGFLERLSYRILEPSAVRRAEQEVRLGRWGSRVRWASSWRELETPVDGVIVANELLDAFPIHRHAWDAVSAAWMEEGVTAEGGRLVSCRAPAGELSSSPVPELPEELLRVLPDGFIVESCPAALEWWRSAAGHLGTGWLVTADYGFDEANALRPERANGTLRSYHRHRIADDILAHPGEQDLTAHVDFGAVVRAGEGVGLRTESMVAQGRWLGAIAVELLGRGGGEAIWLQSQTRALQTLTHPVHLGKAMRVLVQGGKR